MIGSIFKSGRNSDKPLQRRGSIDDVPQLGRRGSSAFLKKNGSNPNDMNTSSILRFREDLNEEIGKTSKADTRRRRPREPGRMHEQSSIVNTDRFSRRPQRSNYFRTDSDRFQMDLHTTRNPNPLFPDEPFGSRQTRARPREPIPRRASRMMRPSRALNSNFDRLGVPPIRPHAIPRPEDQANRRKIIRNDHTNEPGPAPTAMPDAVKVNSEILFPEYPETQPIQFNVPLTSIHPRRPDLLRQSNTMQMPQMPWGPHQSRAPARLGEWRRQAYPVSQSYQVEMLQTTFETTERNMVLSDKANVSLPEPIQKAIREAAAKNFRPSQIDLGEVNMQLVLLQNQLWAWNCLSGEVGLTQFELRVCGAQLLKIMGRLVFLWVELQDKSASVVQVAPTERLEDDPSSQQSLTLTPLPTSEKSLNALTSRWVDFMNGILFVNASKQVGTVVFEEQRGKALVRLHARPGKRDWSKLKRVKKAVFGVFSWASYYDFKIQILHDQVFILKSTFKADRNGKKLLSQSPLHPHSRPESERPVKLRSQSIYSYFMTPRGRLHCKGKLDLKKLFSANRVLLDSYFLASGGFDTSSRVVDLHIRDMPKSALLKRVLKPTPRRWDVLEITQELGKELHTLSNSHNIIESNLVSPSLLLLMDNGVEMEIYAYEGLIRRLETLTVFKDRPEPPVFLGYLHCGEVLVRQEEDLLVMTRSNFPGLNTLTPHGGTKGLAKLCRAADIKSIKDLRQCWSNPRVLALHDNYHSVHQAFSHYKSNFLATTSHAEHNELERQLFPTEISPSLLSMVKSRGQVALTRVLKASDYLLSILWLIALEPVESACVKEYLAYLSRLMQVFGLREVLESALFLSGLEDLQHGHVVVQYHWMARIIRDAGSRILQGKNGEIASTERLKLTNAKFQGLKGILLNVLKVFGGLDQPLFEEANRAFYNEMVKWRLGITLRPRERTLRKAVEPRTLAEQPHSESRGQSQLIIVFLEQICFDLEEMGQRRLVLREHAPVKFHDKRANREEAKVRDHARGVMRSLFLGSSRGARMVESLELRIQSYLGSMMRDLHFLDDPGKRPLRYEFRLNVGLGELKSLLGKVVFLRKLVKGLRKKWIGQKSSPLAKHMMETLSTHSPGAQDRVAHFLEAFAREDSLQGLERVEVMCKMLVNLLIIDSLSPKFMSRLVAELEPAYLGQCLLSAEKDAFFRGLCFSLGSKFFYDKDAIYDYFFDADVRACLQSCELTMLEIKRAKSRLPRARLEEPESSAHLSRAVQRRGLSWGADRRRRAEEEGSQGQGDGSVARMIKDNQREINGVIDKVDVDNIIELGKIFLARGHVEEGLRLADLMCHKFDSVHQEELMIRRVTGEKLEQLRLAKDRDKSEQVVAVSTKRLDHLQRQKEELKFFFVCIVLSIQERRADMARQQKLRASKWTSVVHWFKSSFQRLLEFGRAKERLTPIEAYLGGLDAAGLQAFWEGFLRLILNQSNEEIRVFMLRAVLCLGSSQSLAKVETLLRRADLLRLVDEEMNFKGKTGIQNYFFLIDFFDKKKDFQVAIRLILNICANAYFERTHGPICALSPGVSTLWFAYVDCEGPDAAAKVESEHAAMAGLSFVSLAQKHSLLGKARIMVKKLTAQENKNELVKRIRSHMSLLELQKEVHEEVGDLRSKLAQIEGFAKTFPLDRELIRRCRVVLDVLLFKLDFGKHTRETLLEGVIRPFKLFGSFDHYLRVTAVTESFFHENYFANLRTGLGHYSGADSVLGCFALRNFVQSPRGSRSLIKGPLDSDKIRDAIVKDRLELLARLAHCNLIFPYNVFPAFLSSLTDMMLLSAQELVKRRFRVDNSSLFESQVKMFNEEEVLSRGPVRAKAVERDLHREKVDMIYEMQRANARNGLLGSLMESRGMELLRDRGVHPEPLWFIEHLLSNLADDAQAIDVFDLCFRNWRKMNLERAEPRAEGRAHDGLSEAYEQKQFCRMQAVCLTVIDFLLKTHKKKLEDLAVSLTEEEKGGIRAGLRRFDAVRRSVEEVLRLIVEGDQQISLLTHSSEKYVIWAQALSKGMEEFNLVLKRRQIY